MHLAPGNSDSLSFRTFLVDVVITLQKTDEWQNTVVIISWDDSDGWYDHLSGPVVSHSAFNSGTFVPRRSNRPGCRGPRSRRKLVIKWIVAPLSASPAAGPEYALVNAPPTAPYPLTGAVMPSLGCAICARYPAVIKVTAIGGQGGGCRVCARLHPHPSASCSPTEPAKAADV